MDSYEKFIEKLGTMPINSPRTQSKVEIEILKRLMTADEAEIGCHLSPVPEPVFVIAERADMAVDELKNALETMVQKGVIFKVYLKEPLYALAAMMPGIYEFQLGKLSSDDVKLWERYYTEKIGKELATNQTPLFRIVSVNKNITPEMNVYSYEEVEKLIDSANSITLADCICRTSKKLIGEGCDAPIKDMCIYLDAWGDYMAENKIGRRATKEEAKETLSKARKAGLVHNALNVQQGSFFLCSCCGCCCAGLRGITELDIPTAVARSNFIADISSEACTGCGACVESCHVRALELVDEKARLIKERCIGCGVCEASCEFDAIGLKRKEVVAMPPADINELLAGHAAGRLKE